MEPPTIERKFREKLEGREIQPSEQSWEKLKLQLEVNSRKPGLLLFWSGIAAAVIAGIFYSGDFTGAVLPDAPAVVAVPVEESSEENNERTDRGSLIPVEDDEVQEQLRVQPVKKTALPKAKALASTAVTSSNISVKTSGIIRDVGISPDSLPKKTIEAKLDLIMEPARVNVPDAEVDALLKEAVAKLTARDSLMIMNSISSHKLLREVELEIEHSFRERIFELIKDGYIKTKTAVANRNHQ